MTSEAPHYVYISPAPVVWQLKHDRAPDHGWLFRCRDVVVTFRSGKTFYSSCKRVTK